MNAHKLDANNVAGWRPQKSRRDGIIIEKSRKMSFNPEGVKYRVGNEIMLPLRGWLRYSI